MEASFTLRQEQQDGLLLIQRMHSGFDGSVWFSSVAEELSASGPGRKKLVAETQYWLSAEDARKLYSRACGRIDPDSGFNLAHYLSVSLAAVADREVASSTFIYICLQKGVKPELRQSYQYA